MNEVFRVYTSPDMLGMERYAWLDDPWPWDYDRQREG